ncbi:HTH-type transcriptional repressor PurR [subsurface metagenome]
MQKNTSVTMKQVAKLAKVSVSTVSHVINKTRFVDNSTQQRVLKAMAELSYHPNVIAQSLRRKRTNTVGLIISDIANPFFPEVVRGIEKQLTKKRYSIILANTDDDIEKEKQLTVLLYGKRVDGFIIVTSGGENKHINFLVQQKVPVVLLDRRIDELELDAALVDNQKGAQIITKHLIEVGHRRIGIITGPLVISTGKERLSGYLEALKEHALPRDDELIKIGNFKVQSGHSLALELISLPSTPTAILACNNMMGLGAMNALQEKGIQVPAEMGLAIIDDLPWFRYMDPPLTVVAQPAFELGETAAKLLLERIGKEREEPKQVVLQVELRIRRSAGEIQMSMAG